MHFFRAGGKSRGAVCIAVIRVGESNDFRTLCRTSAEFDRSIVCFRTTIAVTEHNRFARLLLRKELYELFCILDHGDII